MERHVVLLRGINVGKHRQLPMADLRAALEALGHEDVRTLGRSGNVAVTAEGPPARLEEEVARAVAEDCGVEGVVVVARTRDELAAVVAGNPFPAGEAEPKKLQVSFCAGEPDAAVVAELEAGDFGDERVAVRGREVYAFHPRGIADSELVKHLDDKTLGVSTTARNWNTVTKLLDLA